MKSLMDVCYGALSKESLSEFSLKFPENQTKIPNGEVNESNWDPNLSRSLQPTT